MRSHLFPRWKTPKPEIQDSKKKIPSNKKFPFLTKYTIYFFHFPFDFFLFLPLKFFSVLKHLKIFLINECNTKKRTSRLPSFSLESSMRNVFALSLSTLALLFRAAVHS